MRQLQIVDSKGKILSYQGKLLVFEDTPEESDRVNTICWLVNREAKGGPFVVEVVEKVKNTNLISRLYNRFFEKNKS